jgi:uncharacterized protein (TIGR02246 family)
MHGAVGRLAVVSAVILAAGTGRADDPPKQSESPAVVAARAEAAAYARAFNERDFKTLAAQWTAHAELVEGGSRVSGRERIMASIRGWLDRHPQAALEISVTDIDLMATSLARVSGVMRFTRKPGEKPVESRFVSLRVLDDGGWRLAESIVAPSHAAALDDLDWILGTWQAADPRAGTSVETTFERALGGYAIIGRTKVRPKSGTPIETLEIVHADRASGTVRSWTFDSTGARAEGVLETEGTTLNQAMIGTPSAAVGGSVARWERVIAPAGEGRFTLQAIDRSVDGLAVPDGAALHFRKIR